MREIVVLPFDPDAVGVDEAGRGPLAGPLVVAGVQIPSGFDVRGITDSKALSAQSRETCFNRIVEGCRSHIEIVQPSEIDRLNILRATLRAMATCLKSLNALKGRIDGNQMPYDPPCQCDLLVKGDSKDASIAAASILAKVTRDRIMVDLARLYPDYGFETNFGYGNPQHLRAIEKHGPTPIHRKTFDPLKTMLNQPALF